MREADSRGKLQDMAVNFTLLTSITFGDTTDSEAIGMCFVTPVERWVVLDEGFQGSPRIWRTLIFHELGHCLQDQPHIDDGTVDIMNPHIPLMTEDEWPTLVDRMFDRY